jgi:hypothetical protein
LPGILKVLLLLVIGAKSADENWSLLKGLAMVSIAVVSPTGASSCVSASVAEISSMFSVPDIVP